jgi:hypothetical protein
MTGTKRAFSIPMDGRKSFEARRHFQAVLRKFVDPNIRRSYIKAKTRRPKQLSTPNIRRPVECLLLQTL